MGNEIIQQDEQQLVVFDLASEAYGVDIGAVREIIRLQEITKVPRTPQFVEGVINLRGKVIPVIDLRKRFALEVAAETGDNRIVVVDIGGQDIGAVVDAVTEVLRITRDSIEPPASVITTDDSEYLLGIGKVDDKLIILSDFGELITAQASPKTFKPISRAQVLGDGNYDRKNPCWTMPVLANGRIYVRDARGKLVCIDVSK